MDPGTVVLNRFEIERFVGEGGMGTVYRARDRESGGPVALKLLSALGRNVERRFRQEAQVLAQLSHPAIVRFVSTGVTEQGNAYLAMEWLEGEDLAERLTAGPLSAGDSVRLTRRAAEALQVAHSRGIVHRDIKPSNLLLVGGEPSQVKVLDFGIAHLGARTRALTKTGATLGTPGYMAPEQARGERTLDARVDIFALGCVLFECIVGHPAFVADSPLALLGKIVLEDPPRLDEEQAGLPAELVELVAGMLAKDRDERLRDASILESALAAVLPAAMAVGQAARREPAPATVALTQTEQALVTVVAAVSEAAAAQTQAPSSEAASGDDSTMAPSAVVSVASQFGARVEGLRDGSFVAVLTDSGSATDLASRAARFALSVRAHTRWPLSIATGRAVLQARLPIGEALESAIRLTTRGGETSHVRLDDVTAGLLGPEFDLVADERGLLVRGMRAVADPTRRLLGRRTPFVGRARDLATLEATLRECVEEQVARAVLVTADAGMGKSRLRYEFLNGQQHSLPAGQIWITRGDPLRAGATHGVTAGWLGQTCGLHDGEPADGRAHRIRARIGRHLRAADAHRVAAFVGELLGAPVAPEQEQQLRVARADPLLMADLTELAIADFVAAECRAAPLLLVIEDLHWGDGPSIKLLDRLLDRLADLPLMVLALARPEVHDVFPTLWTDRPLTELRLAGLSRKAGERLVRAVLDEPSQATPLVQLIERAGGNPFFLEELARSAAQGETSDVPETVLAMAQQRVQQLEPEARRILRAGSVFGESFWRGAVRLLAGEDAATSTVDEWLDELVRREVLTHRQGQSRFAGELEYTFRHDLIRAAAYGMLTDADRALAHRLAAHWLEQMGESDPFLLAEHHAAGGQAEAAARYYVRAARLALDASDFDSVLARLDEAQRAGMPEDLSGEAATMRLEALMWSGHVVAAEKQVAEALARSRGGDANWLRAAFLTFRLTTNSGRAPLAKGVASRLLDTDPDDDTLEAWAEAIAEGARTLNFLGGGELRDALLERAADIPNLAALAPHAAVRLRLAGLGPTCGGSAAFLRAYFWARAEFHRMGAVHEEVMALNNTAFGCIELGLLEEGEEALDQLAHAVTRYRTSVTAPFIDHLWGWLRYRQGRYPEALSHEQRAVERCAQRGATRLEAASRVYLAFILSGLGRLTDSEAQARKALSQTKIPGLRAYALAALGHGLRQLQRPDEALAATTEALAETARLGGLEEGEARVRVEHTEALLAAAEPERACQAITAARDRLVAIADAIDEPHWRESFLHGLVENRRTLALAAELLETAGRA